MTKLSTRIIHHDYQPPAGFVAPQPGIFKASTVIFPNVQAMRNREWKDKSGYTYGLHGTPSSFILEERLCELEGGTGCLLLPSGLAAIACVNLALLSSGDEMLLPENVYGPSKSLASAELKSWGIETRLYDPMKPSDLASKISVKTKLVWLEAPGSVTMEFPDLAALVKVCKDRGVLVALDNTWGAGIAFNPFDVGIDISAHALTKYPSGGGDVLMGSVITRDAALHLKMKLSHMRLGVGVGANDVETILRSLPSIHVRYAAQDASARRLAHWCQARGEIAQVLHPAIEGSPGHENWRALCGSGGAAAGIFSIVFNESFELGQVDAFCDALNLFKIGYSWGGPISLVVPYDIPSMRDPATSWPYTGILVRLCIGLEHADDLIADLDQAMKVMTI